MHGVAGTFRRVLALVLMMGICLVPISGCSDVLPRASDLVAYFVSQVGNGYIWGASGQISTASFRYARAQLNPDAKKLIQKWGDAWDGLPAFDCIGLFKGFIQDVNTQIAVQDVNTTMAWRAWVADWGTLEGAILQPGMALFRVEGSRMRVQHIGLYVGNGKVVHAAGTRWGVVMDDVPNVFTHWARLNWVDYDTAPDAVPAVTRPFLDVGAVAIVQSDDGEPVTVSPIPHESGKLRQSIGFFADGAMLTILEVPDEISRLVEGVDTKGKSLKGYVRTTELRKAAEQ